jgi:hypothetical protein
MPPLKNPDIGKNVEIVINAFNKEALEFTFEETAALNQLTGAFNGEEMIPPGELSKALSRIMTCKPLTFQIGYHILLSKHVSSIDYVQFINLVDFSKNKPTSLFQRLCVMDHTRDSNTNMEITFEKARKYASATDFRNMLRTLLTDEKYTMDEKLFNFIFNNEQHSDMQGCRILHSNDPYYQTVQSLIKKHPTYSQYKN